MKLLLDPDFVKVALKVDTGPLAPCSPEAENSLNVYRCSQAKADHKAQSRITVCVICLCVCPYYSSIYSNFVQITLFDQNLSHQFLSLKLTFFVLSKSIIVVL